MKSALRRSAAHVFVESLLAPHLDDADLHHLGTVLRLREGEHVSVSDGRWAWRVCRFRAGGGLEPVTEIVTEVEVVPAITIGFALPKGERPTWIVQKLCEIGVERIVILRTERSLMSWDDDRAERQLAKLRTVARQAAMQSRRLSLPAVLGPVALSSLHGPQIALAEPDGTRLSLGTPTVLVGPEGGWSPDELDAYGAHVCLGETVLRVETAALVAGAHLVGLRSRGRGSDTPDISTMTVHDDDDGI